MLAEPGKDLPQSGPFIYSMHTRAAETEESHQVLEQVSRSNE